MRALSLRRLLKVLVAFLCLAGFRPDPGAVSNFTFYADVASSATTDCTPTSGGCTGNCVTPTCGTQAIPCHKIQEAVNLANCTIGTNSTLEADVLVAGGTVPAPKVYNEKVYIYPNIHVIGGGRDVTTIDPSTPVNQGTSTGNAVVTFGSGGGFGFNRPDQKFSITAFKLTHGTGRLIMDLVNPAIREIGGGGVYIYGDAMVTDCRIEDNTLSNVICSPTCAPDPAAPDWKGAGIYIATGGPIISGNIIQRNYTSPPNLTGGNSAQGWGGGIYSFRNLVAGLDALHPIITNNIIRDNIATAQDACGGGLSIFSGLGTLVTNNYILGNSSNLPGSQYIFAQGGGLYVYASNTSIYNNLLMGNVANGGGGGIAVRAWNGPVTLTNNTIVGNVMHQHTVPKKETLSNKGAGIYAQEFTPSQSGLIHLTNDSMSLNDATSVGGGGGLFSDQAFAVNDHNDFFGDAPGASEIAGDYNAGTIVGSNGNVSLNPVFANAPVFWDHTNGVGTSTTVVVFASTRYAVGNRIEYNDDGVSRQITAINSSTKTLTFTPAITYKICSNVPNRSCVTNADCVSPGTCVTAATQDKRILANWGSNTNVTEDLRLTASSPLRDAGTYAGAPSTDLDGLPRPADGNLDGSLLPDIGAYEFRFSDSDGDGVADGSDCAPIVSSVWQIPGEVPSLVMALDQSLSWPRIAQSNVYNIYSGALTSPFAYNPACLISELTGLTASTNVGPPPGIGNGYYYLVGGVNRCGSGLLHSNPPVTPSSACPAQNLDGDLDSWRDIDDNCPTLYNPTQQDSNHNGIGDVCE